MPQDNQGVLLRARAAMEISSPNECDYDNREAWRLDTLEHVEALAELDAFIAAVNSIEDSHRIYGEDNNPSITIAGFSALVKLLQTAVTEGE